ncbi:lysM domain receptor-like kinase 3 [Durio zibethinus]|uniref:LysM domain receptor-like kinase 3 n=1 Tax=Durio zibethinus TaxID=66656 RepID=A0A6P6BFG3_DURZI|nr:lysM domain receptor-like kinase 3 [Durio zibethinus]
MIISQIVCLQRGFCRFQKAGIQPGNCQTITIPNGKYVKTKRTKSTISGSSIFHLLFFLSFVGKKKKIPKLITMASHNLLTCIVFPLLLTLLARICAAGVSMFPCSQDIKKCDALLYHINSGPQKKQIASYYSVDPSTFRYISHRNNQDYLIPVTCTCEDIGNGTKAYLYNASYTVQENDTFAEVSTRIYSGQALEVGGEEKSFITGNKVSMHLLCGCLETQSETIVTYTVQPGDVLSDIATLLSVNINDIQNLNSNLIQNPDDIIAGWVLYVPMENGRIPPPKKGRSKDKWKFVIVLLSAVTLFSTIAFFVILIRRKKAQQVSEEDSKPVSKTMGTRAFSLQSHFLYKENIEDVTALESERPVIYSLEEIEEATSNFDETKKIGTGGYGCVYFGILGQKEVAIKQMKSNKSKEFFAELKVLCKIHHINVVELLGFTSGDDHLYLVYEYVQNGSLNDHLHNPLLNGHQPLSWTARTQIALDAAKGIEYIHDHTKARYVHRDIKTSNILLDKRLRAKVADFGLAKLVERTNEEDLIATRLVGTPGYLPPESVTALQVTPKTDVYAFGVVLAELITGQRALVRDSQEPNKMKSLIAVVNKIFEEEDPKSTLEEAIDGNLRGSYPMEDVYKMAELAEWCLSDDPVKRPEMREIVITLSQILMSSVEWEASLGGSRHVFSGIFEGR